MYRDFPYIKDLKWTSTGAFFKFLDIIDIEFIISKKPDAETCDLNVRNASRTRYFKVNDELDKAGSAYIWTICGFKTIEEAIERANLIFKNAMADFLSLYMDELLKLTDIGKVSDYINKNWNEFENFRTEVSGKDMKMYNGWGVE